MAAPAPAGVAATTAHLAHLNVQVHEMQALLVRLLQDVVRAETRLEHADPAQLVQANEALLLAALDSREAADTATQALQEAERHTRQDVLTHLPNRSALLDRFVQAAAAARRHGSSLALLFVDLDDFKRLNDRHGHAVGDLVLCELAERMLGVVREVDTVSRHGGDEFLILLSEVATPADADRVARKLAERIAQPMRIDELTLQVTASIGVALCPRDGEDLLSLVARADAAMYERKRQRGGAAAAAAAAAAANGTARPGQLRTDPATRAEPGSAAIDLWHANLREANERLLLATLSAQELQAAAERAQQHQQALLAAVAAELREPMAPIRLAASMLGREEGHAPLLPRVQALVEARLSQIASLVAKVVDQARLEDGALPQAPAWLDLRPLVQAEAAACADLYAQRQQTLSLQLGDEPLGVHGDARRLRQVLANLLDNASGHTPARGHVSVQARAQGDTLTLTVADDGLGLTVQQLPHVFEPFAQDAVALGLHGEVALGVGLTVVRALVHAHGGELQAHSDGLHRGSRFVVTLPRVDLPASPV